MVPLLALWLLHEVTVTVATSGGSGWREACPGVSDWLGPRFAAERVRRVKVGMKGAQ
ncbi:unnamed protein product, partial [Sphenostylis stenocarpa]